MSTSSQIGAVVDTVFADFNMTAEDGGLDQFRAALVSSLTKVVEGLVKTASDRPAVRITLNPSAAKAQPAAAPASSGGKKPGNYYSQFYSLICAMKKEDKEVKEKKKTECTLDWELPEDSQFSFAEPAKLEDKQKEYLAMLKEKPDLVAAEFSTRSLRELYATLASQLPSLADMQLTSLIWKFYMDEARQKQFQAWNATRTA